MPERHDLQESRCVSFVLTSGRDMRIFQHVVRFQHMYDSLSRRERQIISIVHRLGMATARDVQAALADAPTYSAVRSALRLLTERGLLRHDQEGKRYVYRPVFAERKAQKGALDHLIETFFAGSAAKTLTAILSRHDFDATDEELERLEQLVKEKRRQWEPRS